MNRVFVDTSAILTLLDRADPRHESVRIAFSGLADDELVTHGYVVEESIAVTRRRFGVDGVITLLDDLLPAIGVVPVEPALHAAAQERYRASLPSGISFVDQVSFAVIQQEGIDTAFAVDGDFLAAGVAVVPPS